MSLGAAQPKAMAGLHALCFPTHPRPWSADEFSQLLSSSGALLIRHPQGFLLGRVIADEAELLTLAVDPQARRQGIGAMLLKGFTQKARQEGAVSAFLEVASDNQGAQALYLSQDWRVAGQRRNYYAEGVDAIVMTRTLADKTVDGS